MGNFSRLALLVGALTCALPASADPELRQLTTESRDIIEQFAKALQRELQAAMEAGGPAHAIEVCNTEAPAIAEKLSTDGWMVKRTSLRVRNMDNAPDLFEHKILRDFEDRKADGWSIDRLAYYKMDEADGTVDFRYMKAIPTQPMCLTCHGDSIPAAVLDKLDRLYPEDQARGFQEGDIRGAFSLRKRYQRPPASPYPDQETRSNDSTMSAAALLR